MTSKRSRVTVEDSPAHQSKVTKLELDNKQDRKLDDYESFEQCPKHKLESRLYCNDHEARFCSKCVRKHHKTCSVKSLSTVYHTFNKHLEQLKYTMFAVEIIKGNLQSYKNKLDVDLMLSEKQIKDIYQEIHQQISKLEKRSLEELNNRIAREKIKISDNTNAVETVYQEVGKVISDCVKAKQPDELSECSQTLHSSLRSTTKQLKKLQESCKEVDICVKKNCKFTDKLSRDTNAILSIAQLSQASLYKTDSLLSACSPFDFISEFYCGYQAAAIGLIPDTDSEIILATRSSFQDKLQHVNAKGDVLKSRDLPDEPVDVCIYDDYVAVPLKKTQQINVYNISDFKEHSKLHVPGICCSVCRHKNTFYVAFSRKKVIKQLKDDGEEIRSSEKIFKDPLIVRGLPSGEGILVTDIGNYRLVSLSNDLVTQQFVITHRSLGIPRGFCFNNQGGIYVCNVSSTIVEFNKEGKFVSTILDYRQGIKSPLFICYDNKNETLAVMGGAEVQIFKGT